MRDSPRAQVHLPTAFGRQRVHGIHAMRAGVRSADTEQAELSESHQDRSWSMVMGASSFVREEALA